MANMFQTLGGLDSATTSTDYVWTQWAGTGATTTATVWASWTSGATYATTTTTGMSVWQIWVNGACRQPVPQLTAEQEAAWRKMNEEKERERKSAQKLALQLLKEVLTRTQLEAFEKNKCIPVDAPSGTKYVIERGVAGNVYSIKDGKRMERLCIHPADSEIPIEDVMLAQKLLLETDEEEFRRIANVTRLAA